jgi:hypothetical protein
VRGQAIAAEKTRDLPFPVLSDINAEIDR